jgi:hypothetical protein
MVFPDNATLFRTLRPDQRGAFGLPVLIALQQFGWERAGNFQIGAGYDPSHPSSPLALDGADPIVRFSYGNVELTGVFDTGAEATNLWPLFASRFSAMLREKGVAGKRTIRGFGGNGTVSEVVLPTLTLGLGGSDVVTAPAHIVTSRTTPNSDWLEGRMGLDLMLQARRVIVDFHNDRFQLIQ